MMLQDILEILKVSDKNFIDRNAISFFLIFYLMENKPKPKPKQTNKQSIVIWPEKIK